MPICTKQHSVFQPKKVLLKLSQEGGVPITYNRNGDGMLAKHLQVKASAVDCVDYRCLREYRE